MNDSINSACSSPDEYEAEGLRDRLRITDNQIAQLEYAISQLANRLQPVLRPELCEPCGSTNKPDAQPVRSPAAQEAHQQGLRIYQAHRDLHSIEQRLAL
jgi:hypothetical protein